MGCTSSKNPGPTAALDIYRPAPSSFAVFDIDSIEEPWLNNKLEANQLNDKPSYVPGPILEKLDAYEATAPRTWEEISNALEEAKKNQPYNMPPSSNAQPPPKEVAEEEEGVKKQRATRKSSSFRTLEELEAKLSPPSNGSNSTTGEKKAQLQAAQLRKAESTRCESKKTEFPGVVGFGVESGDGFRSVRENPFIVMDRLQREKEGKESSINSRLMMRRLPLADYPERCPPGGSQSVVLYTTSLRGVRKTFEDCNRARSVLEIHGVVFDERDVSLHAEFLNELRGLLVEEEGSVSVPRIFIHGRYIGGVDKLVVLNESGRLGRILSWARVERGVGWQGCEGCGGARFVPCLECGGSCKVLVGGEKQRCPECNENGLVLCPLCH